MKKLFIVVLMTISLNGYSQKVYNLDKKKDSTSSTVITSDVAIYKGAKYFVYRSKNDKLFIILTSKKGTQYKKYIN
jgi:hypothetical protein